MLWIDEIKSGIDGLPLDAPALKRFAGVMASVLLAAAAWFFIFRREAGTTLWLILLQLIIVAAALMRPSLLRPFYLAWMTLAFTLGAVVSRLILTLLYFLIITPIGLGLRLFGKDPLQRRWRQKKTSHWIQRRDKPQDHSRYQHLF